MTPAAAAIALRGGGLHPFGVRGVVVAGGVALGVALIVGLTATTRMAAAAFRASLAEVTGRADLRVSGGEAGFPEAVLETVRAQPAVAVATPLVRGTVFAVDGGEPIEIFGVDLVDDEAIELHRGVAPVTSELGGDPLLFLAEPGAVLVSREMAAARYLRVGATLTVATAAGARRLVVHGLLGPSPLARLYDGRVAVMDIDAARALLGRADRVDGIDVVLRQGAPEAAASKQLRAALPAGLAVERPEERGAHGDRMLAAFRALVEASGVLAVLLGVFLAYGATASATAERRHAIALLRVVGATRWQIGLLIAASAALRGLLGALSGIAIGIGLARLLAAPVLYAFSMQFARAVRAEGMSTEALPLGLAALGGAVAAVAGATPAAWVAARAPLFVSLHARGAREPERACGRGWSAALLLVAAGAGLSRASGGGAHAGAIALGLMLAGGALATRDALCATALAARIVFRRLRAGTALVASAVGLAVRGRVVVMVSGLVLGVALVVNLAAIHASVERSVNALLARQLRGDLLVASAHMRGGWLPAPLAGALEAELAAVPGVARIVTVRSIEQPHGDGRLRIRAVGGALDDAALADALIVAGDPRRAVAALRAGAGVAISTTLAVHQRLGVGDDVHVATPSGVRTLRVAAVITDLSSDRGTITMERGLYRRLWHDDLVDVFELTVSPGVDARAVARVIGRRLDGRYQLQVRLTAEHRRERVRAVGRAFAFTGAVELLTALVMLLGLGDNLLASVRERARELALLRALGATRMQIGVLVGQESLFLGLTGGLLGLALGAVVACAWLRLVLPNLIGFAVDFHLPIGAGVTVVGASACLALAAAALPAWRGAGIPTSEALRRAE